MPGLNNLAEHNDLAVNLDILNWLIIIIIIIFLFSTDSFWENKVPLSFWELID